VFLLPQLFISFIVFFFNRIVILTG
jgi:hypothetical protein